MKRYWNREENGVYPSRREKAEPNNPKNKSISFARRLNTSVLIRAANSRQN
jgi:hypothetical protein